MKLHGLQKMTLLDFPGHVACTVFLGGCDFRCPFCHNFELADGSAKAVMTDDEFFKFLSGRKALLDGVAITGGEPCMHNELPGFLAKIKELGFAVKLDTNGYHPTMLENILDKKLADYVAMDIKNSPSKYAETCGIDKTDISVIKKSIGIIMRKAKDYEFRTTVVSEFHSEKDFEEIGKMIKGGRKYFLQAFTDRDTVPFGNLHAPGRDELEKYAAIVKKYVSKAEIRGI